MTDVRNMRKIMEAVGEWSEQAPEVEAETAELVIKFEEELDTLLNNFWGFAERINGGDADAIQGKLEEVLQSYATAHENEMESVETLDEAPILSIENDEVEQHLDAAAKALAKDAVLQASGVWDEEGRDEGGYNTGAKTGKEYVSMAAPGFLDDEYKGSIMRSFQNSFDNYVQHFLEYVKDNE